MAEYIRRYLQLPQYIETDRKINVITMYVDLPAKLNASSGLPCGLGTRAVKIGTRVPRHKIVQVRCESARETGIPPPRRDPTSIMEAVRKATN